MNVFRRIVRKFNKIRCAPLDLYVFHAVSDNFDPERNFRMDWTSTEDFKQNILSLKERVTFISLPEAERRLEKDIFRRKRYAVLTCDDGYASLVNILPWLEEQRIPVTLFLNPRAMEPGYFRPDYPGHPEGLYLTAAQVMCLTSPLVTIGSHGYEHTDAVKMSPDEFEDSIRQCVDVLGLHPRFIPYHAYTWGSWNEASQKVLHKYGLMPVLTDGATNHVRNRNGLSRIPIDGKKTSH